MPSPTPAGPSAGLSDGMHSRGPAGTTPTYGGAPGWRPTDWAGWVMPWTMPIFSSSVIRARTASTLVSTGAVDVSHGQSAPAVALAPGATAPMPAATAATATAAADRRRGIRAVRGGMRRDSTAGRGPPAPGRRPDTPAGASTLDVSAETRCCRGTLPGVRAFVCAGAGFLLAVLWFDLMFDVQVLRHRVGDEPDETRAS